jgi:nucleotide-binding universal stress UspA family protein
VAKPPSPFLGEPYYQRVLSGERQVPHEEQILEGDPAEAVLDAARARESDLMVVGSRGRGGVAGTFLGSVSTEIVHRADRPVLVTRGRTQRNTAAA